MSQYNVDIAKVKLAEAQLNAANNQVTYTKIYAPTTGRLSRMAVSEGQMIAPGQMLGQLVEDDTYVVANFKETQVGRMQPGNPVEIEIDSYPGVTFKGRIESIAAATGARFSILPPDNASGNFVKVVQRVPVRITFVELEPNHPPLRAGLSAEVTVYMTGGNN